MNHSLRPQGLLSHIVPCSFLKVVLMVVTSWTTLKGTDAEAALRGTDVGIKTSQSLSSTSTIVLPAPPSTIRIRKALQTSLLCDPLICPNGNNDINNPKCQDCFHLNDEQTSSSASTITTITQEQLNKCLPENILETPDKDLQIFKNETIPWKMTLSYEIQVLVDIHDSSSSSSSSSSSTNTSSHDVVLNKNSNNSNRQVLENIIYDIKEYVAHTVLAQYLNGTTCPVDISNNNIDLSSATRDLLLGASINSRSDNAFINSMTTDTVATSDSCTITTTTNAKDESTVVSTCFTVESDVLFYVKKENTVHENVESIIETFVETYVIDNNNLHNNIILRSYPNDVTGFTFLNIQMTMIEWRPIITVSDEEREETPSDLDNNNNTVIVDSKNGRIENNLELSSEDGEGSYSTTKSSSLHIWLPSMIVAVITIVIAIVSVLLLHIKKKTKKKNRFSKQDHAAINKQQTSLEDLDNTSSSVSSDVAKDSENNVVARNDPEKAIIRTTTTNTVGTPGATDPPRVEVTAGGGQDESKISWSNNGEELLTNVIPTRVEEDSTNKHPRNNSSFDQDSLAPSFSNIIPFCLHNDDEQEITTFNKNNEKNDKDYTRHCPDDEAKYNDKEETSHLQILFETNEPLWMKQEQQHHQQEDENNDELTPAKVNYHAADDADDDIRIDHNDNISSFASSSSSSSSDASSWSSVDTNQSSNSFDTRSNYSNHNNNGDASSSSSLKDDDPFRNNVAVATITVPSFEEPTINSSFSVWNLSLHER